jgi:hypothetical protein
VRTVIAACFARVPELADLPNVGMDLVFNEVKKRTGGDAQYDLGCISTKN